MTKLHKLLLQLIDDQGGQDIVECAMLAGLFVVTMGGTVPGTAEGIAVILSKMTSFVGSAANVWTLAL